MPRVYGPKTARKDFPKFGIKKGDTYYEWRFYRQPVIKSKTRPRPSQLTQDEARSTVLAAYEYDSCPTTGGGVRNIATDVSAAVELFQEKFDNLPEGFQAGEQGQSMKCNADLCYACADELKDIAQRIEEGELTDVQEIEYAILGTEPMLE